MLNYLDHKCYKYILTQKANYAPFELFKKKKKNLV